jgi:hypothetical protein
LNQKLNTLRGLLIQDGITEKEINDEIELATDNYKANQK